MAAADALAAEEATAAAAITIVLAALDEEAITQADVNTTYEEHPTIFGRSRMRLEVKYLISSDTKARNRMGM